jgi:hypothetical protein
VNNLIVMGQVASVDQTGIVKPIIGREAMSRTILARHTVLSGTLPRRPPHETGYLVVLLQFV